ncbi:unnamed protein product [Boreogadus saida]
MLEKRWCQQDEEEEEEEDEEEEEEEEEEGINGDNEGMSYGNDEDVVELERASLAQHAAIASGATTERKENETVSGYLVVGAQGPASGPSVVITEDQGLLLLLPGKGPPDDCPRVPSAHLFIC